MTSRVKVRRCRVCGCTDNDCRQCVERTGEPCHWVEADLCSACVTGKGIQISRVRQTREAQERKQRRGGTPAPATAPRCMYCNGAGVYYPILGGEIRQRVCGFCKGTGRKGGLAWTGADMIAAERCRQISKEGWSEKHDDKHTKAELTQAAISYAYTLAYPDEYAAERDRLPAPSADWPWAKKWWKPSADPVRNLVKAGALIAAEIDRLLRLQAKGRQ